MPIEAERFRALLSDVPRLTENDQIFIFNTALRSPRGYIVSFYIGTMIRKSGEDEALRFVGRLFGGPPYTGGGLKDWLHFRPTGIVADPCEPENGWVCTVSEDDPWRPEWLRPLPTFPPRPE
jgi:hypothetical protein